MLCNMWILMLNLENKTQFSKIFICSFSDIMYFYRKFFFMFWREGGVAKEGFMGEGNILVEYDRTGL